MLRVRLLGDLAIELDGATLEPPAEQARRALLGWLALDRRMHAALGASGAILARRARRERPHKPAQRTVGVAARAGPGRRALPDRHPRRGRPSRRVAGVDRLAEFDRSGRGGPLRGGARARAAASCSRVSTTTGCYERRDEHRDRVAACSRALPRPPSATGTWPRAIELHAPAGGARPARRGAPARADAATGRGRRPRRGDQDLRAIQPALRDELRSSRRRRRASWPRSFAAASDCTRAGDAPSFRPRPWGARRRRRSPRRP